jgi:hypothetical protein
MENLTQMVPGQDNMELEVRWVKEGLRLVKNQGLGQELQELLPDQVLITLMSIRLIKEEEDLEMLQETGGIIFLTLQDLDNIKVLNTLVEMDLSSLSEEGINYLKQLTHPAQALIMPVDILKDLNTLLVTDLKLNYKVISPVPEIMILTIIKQNLEQELLVSELANEMDYRMPLKLPVQDNIHLPADEMDQPIILEQEQE